MKRSWISGIFSLALAIVLYHGSVHDHHDHHDHDEDRHYCTVCYVQMDNMASDHDGIDFFFPYVFEQIVFFKNDIFISKTDTSVIFLRGPPVYVQNKIFKFI